MFFQQKESPWEGAMRSAAAIWSPLLQNRERTSNQLFHISDWLPTFGLYEKAFSYSSVLLNFHPFFS